MAYTKTPKDTRPATLRIEKDIDNKLKYIAWHDRKTFTDTIHKAAEMLIKKWEKDNEPITAEQLKQAEIV